AATSAVGCVTVRIDATAATQLQRSGATRLAGARVANLVRAAGVGAASAVRAISRERHAGAAALGRSSVADAMTPAADLSRVTGRRAVAAVLAVAALVDAPARALDERRRARRGALTELTEVRRAARGAAGAAVARIGRSVGARAGAGNFVGAARNLPAVHGR